MADPEKVSLGLSWEDRILITLGACARLGYMVYVCMCLLGHC